MKENNRKAIARRARQRKQRARRVALTLCLIVATMLVSVGGTIAWLTDSTGPVVNTFTHGDINIGLYEGNNGESFAVGDRVAARTIKMIPGSTMAKNPYVTVEANSEASWLFVEVVESAGINGFVTYSVDSDIWTDLDKTGPHGGKVYYKEQDATTQDTDVKILTNNEVSVPNTVTKAQLDRLTSNPTLTFYAYAVQSENVADAGTAWGYVPTT